MPFGETYTLELGSIAERWEEFAFGAAGTGAATGAVVVGTLGATVVAGACGVVDRGAAVVAGARRVG